MAFEVVLTEDAERDIEELFRYIAEHDAPGRAESVLAAIQDVVLRLDELPERGNVPKELRSLGIAGYRELHCKPYRIIYQIEGHRVFVHCVLDGRRDMQTLLYLRLMR